MSNLPITGANSKVKSTQSSHMKLTLKIKINKKTMYDIAIFVDLRCTKTSSDWPES